MLRFLSLSSETAAIIGALNLHMIFAMILMHPVEWYLRNPSEICEESQKWFEKLCPMKSSYRKVRIKNATIEKPNNLIINENDGTKIKEEKKIL